MTELDFECLKCGMILDALIIGDVSEPQEPTVVRCPECHTDNYVHLLIRTEEAGLAP